MLIIYIFLACFVASMAQGADDDDKVPGEYFAVLKSESTKEEVDEFIKYLQDNFTITAKKSYKFDQIRMIYMICSAEDSEKVLKLPIVIAIEQNAKIHVNYRPRTPVWCRKIASPSAWGLDRIDQVEALQSMDSLDITATYTVGSYRGAGVMAYVVDSGIETTHPDFGNRAYWGYTAIDMDGDSDLFGHGTHVAGILGSNSYGVAKEVILVSVKILNSVGFGTFATVIDGLQWVLDDHNIRSSPGYVAKSVVNLSIGGPTNLCANAAVQALIDAGVIVVVAAGNENNDACTRTPANVEDAITVGASNVYDESAFFTNWGKCVDIFAPGEFVKSTFIGNSTLSLDGSSMAAPHVAGVAALKLSKDSMTQEQMKAWILKRSTRNKLDLIDEYHKKSPNNLLLVDCTLV